MTAKIIPFPTAHMGLVSAECVAGTKVGEAFIAYTSGANKSYADAFKGTLLAVGLPVCEKATVIPFRRK